MSVLRGLGAAWLVVVPLIQINLFPVRGSGVYLNAVVLTLLEGLAAFLVLRRPERLPWRSRLTVPCAAVAATAVIAGLQGAIFYDRTVAGTHRYVAVEIYAVALILLSVGAAFTTAVACRTDEDVRRFRQMMIVCGGLLFLRTLSKPWLNLSLGSLPWWPMIGAHAVALVTARLLFEKPLGAGRIVAGVSFVASILAAVVVLPFLMDMGNQWLSSWLVVSIPIGLLIVVRFPRESLFLLVPAAIGFLYWQFDNVQRVYILSYREGDFGRLTLWHDALELTYRRPLFGIGPGNYLDYIMRYGQIGAMLSSAHGNYEQLAAETGLVGLGFAVWLFLRSLRLGWSLYRRSTDDLRRSVSIALTCSLAGQFSAAFLGDFILPNYHNGGSFNLNATVYAWVMMGVLMALERRESAPASGEPAAQPEGGDQGDQPGRDPLERHR